MIRKQYLCTVKRKITNVMKAKFLHAINSFIAILLGVLGFGCSHQEGEVNQCEYGVPYAQLQVQGKITDQASAPVENIRVRIKDTRHPVLPDTYSGEDGNYLIQSDFAYPTSPIMIVVDDTANVYEPDSALVEVEYTRDKNSPKDNWYEGEAVVYQDFRLRKKE